MGLLIITNIQKRVKTEHQIDPKLLENIDVRQRRDRRRSPRGTYPIGATNP